MVAGTSYMLSCAAGSDERPTLTWTRDGVEVPAVVEEDIGVFRSTLDFPNVEATDGGVYLCTVRRENRPSITSTGTLTVFSEFE